VLKSFSSTSLPWRRGGPIHELRSLNSGDFGGSSVRKCVCGESTGRGYISCSSYLTSFTLRGQSLPLVMPLKKPRMLREACAACGTLPSFLREAFKACAILQFQGNSEHVLRVKLTLAQERNSEKAGLQSPFSAVLAFCRCVASNRARSEKSDPPSPRLLPSSRDFVLEDGFL
jgi:hypothetical protein